MTINVWLMLSAAVYLIGILYLDYRLTLNDDFTIPMKITTMVLWPVLLPFAIVDVVFRKYR